MATQRKTDRNEEPTEVARIEAPAGLAALAANDSSTETLAKYRILPRLTIVQGSSAVELKEKFGEGATILQPGQLPVMSKEESMRFHPLFFFAEYCLWSDIRDKSSARIVNRTFDPGSDLARRCRAKELRTEKYDGGPADKPFMRRYVEHLCFPGLLYKGDSQLNMEAVVLGFSRGEYLNGQNFSGAILRRRLRPDDVKPAPLWMQVWELKTGRRNRNDYNWWGFNYSVPSTSELAWVSVEAAPAMRALHEELKDQHAKKLIIVERESPDDDSGEPEEAAHAPDAKF